MKRKKANEKEIALPEETPTANNEGQGESAETDSAISGKPESDSGTNETAINEADPITASEEILKNLETYKEALAEEMPGEDLTPTGRKRRTRKEKEPDKSAVVIPPELFVFICDNATANGFVLIDKFITKKGKPTVTADMLSLRKEQAEQLYPVAEKAIVAMKLSDDPIRAFFGSLLAIQFTNYVMIKSTLK
jgi:hypothetical protein